MQAGIGIIGVFIFNAKALSRREAKKTERKREREWGRDVFHLLLLFVPLRLRDFALNSWKDAIR